MNFTGSFPEHEFGASASSDAIGLTGVQLRWFDRWLKKADNGVEHEPPVMLFVMGAAHLLACSNPSCKRVIRRSLPR